MRLYNLAMKIMNTIEPINPERLIPTAYMVISRLERLSADSFWAHRASGLRGSLLRCLEEIELGYDKTPGSIPDAVTHLQKLIDQGYIILENGAREIRVPEK
jgi:hypothetical protein